MGAMPALDVRVIYSASGVKRRRGRGVAPGRSARRWLVLIVGSLNLAAAVALYYATWWQVDSFMYVRLMWKTPIVGLDSRATSGFFVARMPPPTAGDSHEAEPPAGDGTRFSTTTTQRVLWTTAYGWLTVASVASGILALAAGAAIGRFGGSSVRRIGLISTAIALPLFGLLGYIISAVYGWKFPLPLWRAYMVGPVLIALAAGVALGRGVRVLTVVAAAGVIASAIASVIGLYLGSLCDALEPQQATTSFMGIVFLIHGAWGILLIPLAWRLPR